MAVEYAGCLCLVLRKEILLRIERGVHSEMGEVSAPRAVFTFLDELHREISESVGEVVAIR